jgi:serine/threonine protein kinase
VPSSRAPAACPRCRIQTSPPLFDVGQHNGRIFIVFEYLKGQSLRQEMGGRPMNVRRALELGIQMADAIANAHACGYAHCGLSPDSVVITAKGHAKIPALALASRDGFAASDAAELHDYNAPEEAKGLPSDERSDIYSVGAVMYETLTGRRPMHRGAAPRVRATRTCRRNSMRRC